MVSERSGAAPSAQRRGKATPPAVVARDPEKAGAELITMQTGPQPADFADVRATNLAVVLRHVRTHAPCSRADIAATTGLNKATVSSLVADLIDRRLLRESGLTEHRIGRPATMLVLDGAPYAAVGLEIDADHLTAVAIDLAGGQLLSWRRSLTTGGGRADWSRDGRAREGTRGGPPHDDGPLPAAPPVSPGRAVSAIAALAGRAVNRLTAQGRQVLRLTVAVPGLVGADGVVRVAANLGWRDVDLRGDLLRALRNPDYDVAVENDANLAALAEFRYGAFAGTANLIHITSEVGVGAGVIVEGRLIRGGNGFSGELGHVQLDPDGAECRCGRRGCLEAMTSAAAIVAKVLPEVAKEGSPADLATEIDEVVRRARQGDRATIEVLAQAGRHLGQGVALLANLINPEVVALGGNFVPLAPWLLPAAEAELFARVLAPAGGGCRLVASALGHGAAATGGAARALDEVDAGRLPSRPAALV
jgi:predicted NBD/HSP70 family sugar kinase